MEESQKNNHRYLPLIFAGILIAGILIGTKLPKKQFNSKYDKIGDVINMVMQNYVDSVDKESLKAKAITGMLESLDPHSVYIPASDFNESNDPLLGKFEGIGVQFRLQKDTIMVITPVTGGPSEKVGIRAGDRIVTVDGKNVAGVKIKDIDVMRKLKGKKGTKVKVGILRRGIQHPIEFTIVRDVIPTYSIDVYYMVDKETGYIKLSKFSETSHEEFLNAMEELKAKGLRKLILDLRDNGGGYLQTAIALADEFLSAGKMIVYTEGRNQANRYSKATSRGIFEKEPLVILIDEFSASASEIISGAIQDNDRGLIIGRRSFGKGLVQEQYFLSDSSAIRLTVARYHTPTGRCIQRSYKNGMEDYMNDLNQRLQSGELENPDLTKFADSLKFKTPKGKIVYGGGGIMPDIYVPLHANKKMEYYNAVSNKGLIYQYAFDYVDKNRVELNRFKTSDDYIKNFNVSDAMMKEFIAYAEKNAIKTANEKESNDKIKVLLKAYIGRNLLDDKCFYPIYLSIDPTFGRAMEEIKKMK